eukprot:11193862-Lingulodinium_polyedra.AAC.1
MAVVSVVGLYLEALLQAFLCLMGSCMPSVMRFGGKTQVATTRFARECAVFIYCEVLRDHVAR